MTGEVLFNLVVFGISLTVWMVLLAVRYLDYRDHGMTRGIHLMRHISVFAATSTIAFGLDLMGIGGVVKPIIIIGAIMLIDIIFNENHPWII